LKLFNNSNVFSASRIDYSGGIVGPYQILYCIRCGIRHNVYVFAITFRREMCVAHGDPRWF
jgi:hypothetical protein